LFRAILNRWIAIWIVLRVYRTEAAVDEVLWSPISTLEES